MFVVALTIVTGIMIGYTIVRPEPTLSTRTDRRSKGMSNEQSIDERINLVTPLDGASP